MVKRPCSELSLSFTPLPYATTYHSYSPLVSPLPAISPAG